MARRLGLASLVAGLLAIAAHAAAQDGPRVTLDLGGLQGPESLEAPLKLALLATAVGLAPALAVMATSFTRLIIVLHFVRQALGTQSMPPNQVLAGLALFLTFFVMLPVATQINDTALAPYQAGELDATEALQRAQDPVKQFMLHQTRDQDLTLFLDLAGLQQPATRQETPLRAVLPAFVLSEIKTAFQIGFVLFLPFLIIDLVVASVLVSMGMLMLPPVVISFPFKVLLFVLADGWSLVIGSTIRSFLS
jgi:flagellar biosynthetic protein FliP